MMEILNIKPTFSIIAPVYNEESVLLELYRRVKAVMDAQNEPWELVLVNDGSRDRSAAVIAELHAVDPRVKGVSFSRNFGFQLAVTAGLDHAVGDAVILTDADLQDPPEVFPEMIARWGEGYDVVYGVRASREGETWFKLFTAGLFYRLIRKLTDVDIPLDTGDFRLMDRRVVDAIRRMPERHRFLRGMVPWVGYRQIGVPYERKSRYAGESKFGGVKQMLPFAIDAITSFSYLPLRLAAYAGAAVAGLGVLALVATGVGLLIGAGTNLVLAGLLAALLLLMGGLQMAFIGILGEYMGRIYDEARARPPYLVGESWGYSSDTPLLDQDSLLIEAYR
jgi:dolichol-phosphate mannosyltransferase